MKRIYSSIYSSTGGSCWISGKRLWMLSQQWARWAVEQIPAEKGSAQESAAQKNAAPENADGPPA